MKKMSWKPLIEHGACDEVLQEGPFVVCGCGSDETLEENDGALVALLYMVVEPMAFV